MSKDFNLIATIRVMPESADVNMENIKEQLKRITPDDRELYKIEDEPIAFGLVALNVMVLSNDREGGDVEPVVEAYSSIQDVGEVDVIDVRRLL